MWSLLPIVVVLAFSAMMFFSMCFQGSSPNYFEVLERILIVLMGEYPDPPATVFGRVLQLALLLFSTVLVGGIVGKVSAFFVARSLRGDMGMKKWKRFVVVCGWNAQAATVVRELLRSDEKLGVLVAHAVRPEDAGLFEDEARVCFKVCDPMRYETLKELDVLRAKSVILLSDQGVENPDDKNALIALAIKHLEEGRKDVHVVVELTDAERKQHLLDAGADEVICSANYTAGIIAQSAVHKRMSEIYERLLTYSSETNEIYFLEGASVSDEGSRRGKTATYPAAFIGKSFPELVVAVSQVSAKKDTPTLLLGVRRSGEIFLNPAKLQLNGLQTGDDLIVLSYTKPVLLG